MTTAEELRKYANEAHEYGGFVSFLDEHLDTLASRAEAEQAENEGLRGLLLDYDATFLLLLENYDGEERALFKSILVALRLRASRLGIEVG